MNRIGWAKSVVVLNMLVVLNLAVVNAADEPSGTRIASGATVDLFKQWPAIDKAPKPDLTTIEFWIRPDQAAIARARAFVFILSNRRGRDTAGLSLTLVQGAIRAHVFGTTLQANGKLPANRWSHVALTVNTKTINKQATLWLDGKRIDEKLVLEYWPKTFEVAQMFSDQWNQGRIFTGQIGDVRISREVRYTAEFNPPKKLTKDTETVLFFDGKRIPLQP
jgi:hypothetical protein